MYILNYNYIQNISLNDIPRSKVNLIFFSIVSGPSSL